MNPDTIKQALGNIDEEYKKLFVREHEPGALLLGVFTKINEYLESNNLSINSLCPEPKNMFKTFNLCRFDRLKVVILGQDPYTRLPDAQGMSFSVPNGVTVPASLRVIYNCLMHNNLISSMPEHGCLDYWAEQGVLMLNAALTTVKGKSNEHAVAWKPYTDYIIKTLDQVKPGLIFILWGNFAKDKSELIKNGKVLTWGHPSPISAFNKNKQDQRNFIYCDNFKTCNEILISSNQTPIDWFPQRYIYIAADGGASGNGKNNCKSSWAYVIACQYKTFAKGSGIVEPVEIPGEKFTGSNNRGELTGILNGLNKFAEILSEINKATAVAGSTTEQTNTTVIVLSDSNYALQCIFDWGVKWKKNPKLLEGKKNLDLIMPCIDKIAAIANIYKIAYKHINSHTQLSPNIPLFSQFHVQWTLNSECDTLCSNCLS
jgi:uracil-DNA glycosylase